MKEKQSVQAIRRGVRVMKNLLQIILYGRQFFQLSAVFILVGSI